MNTSIVLFQCPHQIIPYREMNGREKGEYGRMSHLNIVMLPSHGDF